MGASDFLSGSGLRFGARMLADATLARRSGAADTAVRRPPVLQRHHGPTQLSLFSQLESRSHLSDTVERDAATDDEPVTDESPDGSPSSVD